MSFNTAAAVSYQPKTQKAKSLYALKHSNYKVPSFTIRNAAFYRENPGMLHELVNRFVRPCPMVPRHGFVDSRPINSIAEAEQILNEAIAAEPEAEIIAMPFIAAEFSAIFTPGSLVIGPGNDGATLGHGSKVIPTLGHPGERFQWETAQKAAGINESPFCEILFQKDKYATDYSVQFVQLRNGPKLPAAIDYIPAEMTITRVVIAKAENGKLINENGTEIDLLEWEETAKQLGNESGVVVYHPNGSLASHCAVHCVLNNVPVITSFVPCVGNTLKPNAAKAECNMEQMKAGFVLGCSADMNYQQAAFAMLAAAHLTSVWIGKQDALLGFGMGCAYRLTVAAGLGEMRHRRRIVLHAGEVRKSRDSVYKGCWNKILTPSTRQRFVKAIASFSNEYWGGSFGGKKWAAFCMFAAETFNALLDNDGKKALTAFNQTVHAAHNGGWAFDKFLSESTMTKAEQNPMFVLLPSSVNLYSAIVAIEQKPELAQWFRYRCKFETSKEIASQVASHDDDDDSDNEYHCAYCGDSDCSGCKPEPSYDKSVSFENPIVQAQVCIKGYALHVQYKTQAQINAGVGYTSADINMTSGQQGVNEWQEQLAHCEQSKSFAGGDTVYYKATQIYPHGENEQELFIRFYGFGLSPFKTQMSY